MYLKVNEKQKAVLIEALEFYYRTNMWQIDKIPFNLEQKLWNNNKSYQDLQEEYKWVRNVLFPELAYNESYWVWQYQWIKWKEFLLDAQIAYEIQKWLLWENDYLHYSWEDKVKIYNELWDKITKNNITKIDSDLPF